MISSLSSSRPSIAPRFTPAQEVKPAATAEHSQGTSPEALRQRLMFTDSFESSPTARSAPVSGAAPGSRPHGAGSAAVDTGSLVQSGQYQEGQDYKALSYDEPQQYNGQSVGFWKSNVWNAATDAGATKEEAALLVAQVMQEGGTDFNKSGDATNFGPFNLNKDMLQTFGKHLPGDLQQLNGTSPEAIQLNVQNALDVMREVGANNYLHHVRGGSTNFTEPSKRISDNPDVKNDDAFAFERALAHNAKQFLQAYEAQPSSLTTNHRFASDIPNI
jgi:hypothetical protein